MNLERITNDFLTDNIYLNNASVSIMPISSINAMKEFLITYGKIGPDSVESEQLIKELWIKTRKTVSDLIKCKPDEVVLTQSTTDGVNIVANGIKFETDSNIVIRGKGHEHHANYFPWLRLTKKINLQNLQIDQNGSFSITSLRELVNPKTKLVALSHGLYNTGQILPVNEIGEFLKSKNIPYFLDTAQTVGCIGEFDFSKTNCDFMAFNGSKWLCGPMGTGVFYCRKNSSDLLEPVGIGGESALLGKKDNLEFMDLPEKFQAGYRNYVGLVGMESSIKYLLDIGLDNIRNHIIKLSSLFRNEITKIPGVTVFGPDDESHRTSIISFDMKDFKPEYVVEKLQKKQIVIAKREIMEKKILRISPHLFNSESEILKTVEELKKI
jgi:cysteine desulfurase/selenocysteine lyase